MSDFEVKAKSQYQETVGARSIFIDSITVGAALVMRCIFEDGSTEDHNIVSGSKFNSPEQKILVVIFLNSSGSPIDVSFHYSTLLIYDETKTVSDVSVLSLPKSTGYVVGGDVTLGTGVATAIRTADSTTRSVMITSLIKNTDEIRIGSAPVDGTHGTPLQPGETLTLETTEAIYGFCAVAGQKVAFTVTTD